jgi:DNA polymerase-3 subunit gamma/tau
LQEADELAPQTDKPRDAFTEEQLHNFYTAYLEKLRAENKPRLLAALSGKLPQLQGKENALLHFENQTQEKFYREARLGLLRHLRKKLNNYSLVIETKIKPGSQQAEPYSPKEKFDYMVKKNPALAELKKRLDLDLE